MEKYKRNKKAQGHVELIVSFVLFVSFLLVILLFLYPLNNKTLKSGAISSVQEKLFNNLSINYVSSFLILNSEVNSGCFRVDNLVNVNSRVVIKDSTDGIKQRKLIPNPSNSSQVIAISIESTPENRVYKLFFSEFFNRHNSSCLSETQLLPEDYNFGPLNYERAILYENLFTLNSQYTQDYNALKNQLGLTNNFDFVVLDKDKNIILSDSLSKKNLKRSNVLARDIPLRAINKNATFIDIILHLEVW